jgi:hypothetical protein
LIADLASPDILAAEIVADLMEAMEWFRMIAHDIGSVMDSKKE